MAIRNERLQMRRYVFLNAASSADCVEPARAKRFRYKANQGGKGERLAPAGSRWNSSVSLRAHCTSAAMYSVADSAAGLALYSPSDHRNSKLHPRRVVSEQTHESRGIGSLSREMAVLGAGRHLWARGRCTFLVHGVVHEFVEAQQVVCWFAVVISPVFLIKKYYYYFISNCISRLWS